MNKIVSDIVDKEGDLDKFSQGYKNFGLHVLSDNSIKGLEWAPGASQLYLKGDFSESCCYESLLSPNFQISKMFIL